MISSVAQEEYLETLARRGAYCLLMGVGAFFAFFNEMFGWVKAPDYPRLTDVVPASVWLRLDPYMPHLSILLGFVFLSFSGYYFYQYSIANSSNSPAA